MKILIEIDDNDYADIMSDSERNLNHYERLIKKGVPLPEGHGRLIDANRLRSMYSINRANFNTVVGIQKWIDDAPTIIEADKESEDKE